MVLEVVAVAALVGGWVLTYGWLDPSVRSLPLSAITRLLLGKQTQVLSEFVPLSVPASRCVSMVTAQRSLDLCAVSAEERDAFVQALRVLLA